VYHSTLGLRVIKKKKLPGKEERELLSSQRAVRAVSEAVSLGSDDSSLRDSTSA